MRKMVRGVTLGAALAGLCGALAFAVDNDELMPGRIFIVKPGVLAKFVAKPVSPALFDLPDLGLTGNDPTVEPGSTLRIRDLNGMGGDNTYLLPIQASPLGWRGLGNPAGSKGFKYKGAGTAGDPCKVVLVKSKVVKGVCRGGGVTLTPPFTGTAAAVRLNIGTTTKSYCARFGGTTIKNTSSLTKRKGAGAPSICSPSGAFLEVAQNLF